MSADTAALGPLRINDKPDIPTTPSSCSASAHIHPTNRYVHTKARMICIYPYRKTLSLLKSLSNLHFSPSWCAQRLPELFPAVALIMAFSPLGRPLGHA
ncbi:hypothetical protein MRB53_040565 [Persea americana]|nr:hypothetical protein MRB53_040565 [Persea americana]